MPFKFTYNRRRNRRRNFHNRRKRVMNRRTKIYTPATRLSYLGNGISDKYTCSLVWTVSGRLNTTSGATAKGFNANVLNDTTVAASSTPQPLYFKELSALFQHYRVHSCRIVLKCNLVPDSTSVAQSALVCVYPSRVNSSTGAIHAAIQQPRAKYRLVSYGNDTVRLVNFASTKAMLPFKDMDQSGQGAASPIDKWYWWLMLQDTQLGVEGTQLDYSIEMYFRTTFYERIPVTQSGSTGTV